MSPLTGGGRLQPVLMRHPPTICEKPGGGAGGQLGGGSVGGCGGGGRGGRPEGLGGGGVPKVGGAYARPTTSLSSNHPCFERQISKTRQTWFVVK